MTPLVILPTLDHRTKELLVVGGSIVIPHLRHAVETLDLARAREAEGSR